MQLSEKRLSETTQKPTHISRTVFSCSSFDFFSSMAGSAFFSNSVRRKRAMSSISCSCWGCFSFRWPVLKPPYFSNSSKKLQSNTAICQLYDTCKHEHITPVLKYLHRLPILERITFKILSIVFKAFRRLAPQYIFLSNIHTLPPFKFGRFLKSATHTLQVVQRSGLRQRGPSTVEFLTHFLNSFST